MIHTKTSSTTISSGSTDAPFTHYTTKSTLFNSTQMITDVTPNTSTKRTSTSSYNLSSTGKKKLDLVEASYMTITIKIHWQYQTMIDNYFLCTLLVAGVDASETEAVPMTSTVSSIQCIDEQPWCGHAHCSKKIVRMYCKRKCNLCPICK